MFCFGFVCRWCLVLYGGEVIYRAVCSFCVINHVFLPRSFSVNRVWRREGIKGQGSHGDFALLFINVALSQEELLITSVL